MSFIESFLKAFINADIDTFHQIYPTVAHVAFGTYLSKLSPRPKSIAKGSPKPESNFETPAEPKLNFFCRPKSASKGTLKQESTPETPVEQESTSDSKLKCGICNLQ